MTSQQQGERNFHIFYQIMAESGLRSQLGLGKDHSAFRYFSDAAAAKVRTVDDAGDFHATTKAMGWVGLEGQDQADIFAVLGGILHLGNVTFASTGRDQSQVSSSDALSRAAGLLGVNEHDLGIALTHRTVKSGIEQVRTGLSVEKAEFARDALAKSIYGKLFEFIVERANETLHVEQYSTTIGILDIYGFEILGVNGFEQLCINHTNERLHQLFIELTLRGEQEEYRKEGISWTKVDYFDNLPICEMMERRGGIYALVDEESIFPQGCDASLIKKLTNNVRDRHFRQGREPTQFEIKHYAGTVTYDVGGMVEANKDTLYPDLVLVMVHTSQNPVAKRLFRDHPAMQMGRKTNKRPPTTATQYKKQVFQLMETLKTCNQHYIRCIKPNEHKRSGMFEAELCMEQVRYLGLLENVKVRRAGYAFRMTYDEFMSKYKAVIKGHPEWDADTRRGTEKVLREYNCREFEMGRTKVFIKNAKDILGIEDARKDFMDDAASYLIDDGLIYADKVHAFNKATVRSEVLLVVGGKGFYWFDVNGRQVEHFIPYEKAELVGYNRSEGWMTVHSTYPGKREDDPKVQVTYLSENIYPAEIENFVEVLGNLGVDIQLSKASSMPLDARDAAAYKQNRKLIGTGALGLPQIGNGRKAPKQCCTIA